MISRLKSIILGNWGGRVFLSTVVVSGLILILRQLGTFEGAELRSYDSLIRSRKDQPIDDRLLVIKITDDDLKIRDEAFIYDQTLADAMKKLQQYQPSIIALDVDRSIPMPKLPKGEERTLKQELEKPNVVAVCALSGLKFEGISPPPEIDVNQVGFADLPEDSDGVIRRSLLITTPPTPTKPHQTNHLCNDSQGDDLFSFAFLTSLLYLQSQNIEVAPTEDFKIKVGEQILDRLKGNSGGYQTAEENMGTYSILIDYRHGESPAQTLTLSQLLEGDFDPQLIQNKIVLIGYDSIAIPDTKLTPYSAGSQEENASMLGVVVHAQIISQILNIAIDGAKPIGYLPQPVEWLWIISWATMGGLITFRGFKQLWLVGIIELGTIGILMLIVKISMGSASLWLPLPPTLVALILTTVGTILIDRVPTVQKMLKINIEIDWDQVRKDADQLVSLGGSIPSRHDLNLVEEVDLEEAEKKAKQSYLEELQKRAKERRKKKYIPSTETAILAPIQEVETEQNLFARLQGKITQLKDRLSSRRGKATKINEVSIPLSSANLTTSQTIEQQAEIQELELYIEEVLHHARTIRQQIES